jgi:hypothetical protein
MEDENPQNLFGGDPPEERISPREIHSVESWQSPTLMSVIPTPRLRR